MSDMNPKVDDYIRMGCGRCELFDTPDCKVHPFVEELQALRAILLETDLTEDVKWSFPCYTYNGSNVLILSALKNYCSLDFFKGVLLKDPEGVLIQQTENMQATRQLRYTSVEQVEAQADLIKAYVAEAIEIEKQGLKVEYKDTSEFDVPDELVAVFEEDPQYETAFYSLTPGRQRGYLLYFASAKQSKTRTSRIEKYRSKVFDGKGVHER